MKNFKTHLINAVRHNIEDKKLREEKELKSFIDIYGERLQESCLGAVKRNGTHTYSFSLSTLTKAFIRDIKNDLSGEEEAPIDDDDLLHLEDMAEKALKHWGLLIDINGVHLIKDEE